MDLVKALEPLWRKLPEIEPPKYALPLKNRLINTFIVLIFFLLLGEITPYGLESVRGLAPEAFQVILASQLGSVLAAGIGPIVVASIILQLLVGSEIIRIDMRTEEGRRTFMGMQKLLAIFFSFFEAWIYVSSGFLKAYPGYELLVALQVALGSIILIYLDEIVLKWGIGSGISLFIAAGVSKLLFWNGFGIHPQSQLMTLINSILTASPAWWTNLIPYITTLIVFLIVLYAEGIRVELPIAMGAGAGMRIPIRLLFLSNIPVIFAVALFVNIQLLAFLLKDTPLSPILGIYEEVPTETGITYRLVGGLAYFTQPPTQLMNDLTVFFVTGQVPQTLVFNVIHAVIYILLLTVTSVAFGLLWLELSGHNPKQMAEQIVASGMGIPGFRRDPRVVEKVLQKYIPVIAVIGSAFVGFIAGFSDVFRGLVSGIGLLLTIDILIRYWDLLSREKVEQELPFLRRILG